MKEEQYKTTRNHYKYFIFDIIKIRDEEADVSF